MPWLYNSHSGAIIQTFSPASNMLLSGGLGWHGPFKSHQEAVDFYNNNKGNNPGWKAPTDNISDQITNTITSVPSDAATGAADAVKHSILGGVDIQAWFVRIGEILLGIVLIGVGIAKLTGTTNLIAKAAKDATKAAMIV